MCYVVNATNRRNDLKRLKESLIGTVNLIKALVTCRDLYLFVLSWVVIAFVFVGLPYTAYKYGRATERKDLMNALVKEISVAFWEGSESGYKRGYDKANKECDEVQYEDGRY